MEYGVAVLIGAGIIGFVVGCLTGIFGVGGGFLMTPALMIILGIPPQIAVGTDLATILANSSFGMLRRRGSGTVDFKLALTISAMARYLKREQKKMLTLLRELKG